MKIDELINIAKPVKLHANRCIQSFSFRATCKQCVQICPDHSIAMIENHIDVHSCVGCGKCVQVCNHDVFEMDFPSVLQSDTKGFLILCCKKEGLIDLPVVQCDCLNQFTFLQLALMVRHFGKIYLYHDEKTCIHCQNMWFPNGQIELMKRYGLEAYASKIIILNNQEDLKKFVAHEGLDINQRRSFIQNQFKGLKSITLKYAKETADAYVSAVGESLSTKSQSFEKAQAHAMLLSELYSESDTKEDECIPLKKLSNSACRYCHICEKLCPWDAIAIVEKEGKAVLAHHDVLCARCGLCIDLCPEKGLLWTQGLRVKDVKTPRWRILNEAEAATCECCGELFYPTKEKQTICSFCTNKK